MGVSFSSREGGHAMLGPQPEGVMRGRQRFMGLGRVVIGVVWLSGFWITAVRVASGQDEEGIKVGSEVVLRTPDASLRANQRDIPTGWDCLKYRVLKVDGPWVWIASDELGGWINRDQVVSFDQAIECYSEVLSSDPNATWAYLWRAQAHYYRDDLEAALGDLNEAVKRNPRDAAALVQRGVVRLDHEEPEEALADFDLAQRISPGDPDVLIGRAQAYHALGRTTKALADLDRAIQIEPNSSEACEVRGAVLAEEGDFEDALEALNEAVRLKPDRSQTYLRRGVVRYDLGQFDWAVADLNEAIRLDPGLVTAYQYRGHVRAAIADDAGALADYQEAARQAPEDLSALNDLAWFLAACPDAAYRDGRKAIEAATRASELAEWKDPDMIDTLAASYAEVEEFDEALKWQAKALELTAKDHVSRQMYLEHQALFKERKPCRLDR